MLNSGTNKPKDNGVIIPVYPLSKKMGPLSTAYIGILKKQSNETMPISKNKGVLITWSGKDITTTWW